MADYYTNVSFWLDVPAEHRAWFSDYVAARTDNDGDDPDEFIGFLMVRDGDGSLHFQDDEGQFGLPGLVTMLHRYLKEMEPDGVIAFQVAYTCSKPRADAYGGEAFVITATKTYSMGTGGWIGQQLKRLERTKQRKPLVRPAR